MPNDKATELFIFLFKMMVTVLIFDSNTQLPICYQINNLFKSFLLLILLADFADQNLLLDTLRFKEYVNILGHRKMIYDTPTMFSSNS